MEREMVPIKEVSNLLGVSRATVNYYSNIGLFKVADRRGNTRFYDKKSIVETYGKIKSMRMQGYSLSLIQKSLTGISG